MHSVSQRPNLRHLGEPLGGAKSLLEAVSFKKATEGMCRVANARWERVPHSGVVSIYSQLDVSVTYRPRCRYLERLLIKTIGIKSNKVLN